MLSYFKDISLVISAVAILTYIIFSFDVSLTINPFRILSSSYKKPMGILAMLVYFFGFFIGSLIFTLIFFRLPKTEYYIYFSILILNMTCFIILVVLGHVFSNKTTAQRYKIIVEKNSYKNDIKIFNRYYYISYLILILSGVLNSSLIFIITYAPKIYIFYGVTALIFNYIACLHTSGTTVSYALLYNFKKYIVFSSKLNDYNIFLNDMSGENANIHQDKTKVFGYLISEDKENIFIKPDKSKALCIKKNIVDIIMPDE